MCRQLSFPSDIIFFWIDNTKNINREIRSIHTYTGFDQKIVTGFLYRSFKAEFLGMRNWFLYSYIPQIGINFKANVGILSAVLLFQCWQITLVRYHFCSSGWRDYQRLVWFLSNALSPTSPAYAIVTVTILFQVSCWANVGSTLPILNVILLLNTEHQKS